MEKNVSYVVCKICGKKGRILTDHLKKKHGLSRKEYEEIYSSPAVCYERQLIQIHRNKELNDKLNNDPYYVELMRKVRHNNGKLPQVQKALQKGHLEYANSEEGRKRNSEIMKRNHRDLEIQKLATAGKLNSEKFRKQKSEQMTKLARENWSNEEWKSEHLSKMFDGSKKEYTDVNNNKVLYRSNWELKLHNYLTQKKIDFRYEFLEIRYISTDKREHRYIPDFYLPDYNLVLEVKPHMYISNKVNQIKKEVTEQSGYRHMFVTENELKDLNCFFHNKIYGTELDRF